MTETVMAREYLRVSFDRSGRERSQDEQHDDNQRVADRRGWKLARPYRDTGSASRHARKRREDFERLISDLDAGRYNAQILMLWESSRGSRKLSEWVRLIELCEQQGVQIFVTSDGKLYDLTEARDRRSLQEDATDAEYESAKISKRTRRAAASSAAAGRPGPGRAAYGYRRVYDAASGRMTGQEIDPVEAAIVREIYARLHAGHSLRAIAADLQARGVLTRSGREFSSLTVRSIALNRANIGERVHDPLRPGRRAAVGRYSPDAAITSATWPPIVDRALWTAVHQRLTDPSRTTTRPARGVHWLTWLAQTVVCGVCDGPLQARTYPDSTGTPALHYYCHNSTHVRVPYAALDTYAETVLLAYLGRDDIAQALTADPTDPAGVNTVMEEIATIEQDIDDLADQLGAGGPAARRLLERSLPTLEARLAAARKRKDELTAPSLLRGLIEPGKDVRRRWKVVPMAARREIARLLFVPELLGQLRIVRAPVAGQRTPIEQRVEWARS